MEAERAIFSERAIEGEVIVIPDDEEHSGGKVEEEFNVEEWRRIFPDSETAHARTP